MLLHNFYLNSDYDTMKEVADFDATLSVSGTVASMGSKTSTTDIKVNPGSYFEMASVSFDTLPGQKFTTLAGGTDDLFKYEYLIYRKDATTYRVELYATNLTATTQTANVTASVKLHLFMSSADD